MTSPSTPCTLAGHERDAAQGMQHLPAAAMHLGPLLQSLDLGVAPPTRLPQRACPSGRRLRDLEPHLVIPALRRLWCAPELAAQA